MADVAKTRQFSCHQCRARKLKCNRLWPCERCSQLGEECVFPEARQRPGYAANLKRPKVKELEGRLSKLQPADRKLPQCTSRKLIVITRIVDLEHRLKQQREVEQHTTKGHLLDAREYPTQVAPTGRLEQLPPQPVVDELYVLLSTRAVSGLR